MPLSLLSINAIFDAVFYRLNVRFSTTLPPCWTMICAVVKSTLSSRVDQWVFGQPASRAPGVGGGWVVTQTLRLPFLISVAGMEIWADGCTGVLFWPGA
jgi:hypothetical protein